MRLRGRQDPDHHVVTGVFLWAIDGQETTRVLSRAHNGFSLTTKEPQQQWALTGCFRGQREALS